MDRKAHWETIYRTKLPTQVSWYQSRPRASLELIRGTGAGIKAAVIDVGGGASTLVDCLLEDGYRNLTVLDVSGEALETSKRRLGERSKHVKWVEDDITTVRLPSEAFDIWHDRAFFHFLIDPKDRKRYLAVLGSALQPEGHVIVATFAADGPPKCSGLVVARYSIDELRNEFGAQYKLLSSLEQAHQTPFETQQKFIYCCFKKVK